MLVLRVRNRYSQQESNCIVQNCVFEITVMWIGQPVLVRKRIVPLNRRTGELLIVYSPLGSPFYLSRA